ncbi:methyltransferase [Bhargavaea cecembensis]|uniref:Methyltransferase n=1 Tax=Bhargavaea cecembensis TaxID=394098 RepID=A0A161RIR8_9BACL|nr:class I SAM-dependent methyltransferase [Bhargavaea cecembensis]KZE40062.1 methyltransferase [Bhargavaea cecembensis]
MNGESYRAFASVYDLLMEDIPYGRYAERVLEAAGPAGGQRLLDIGCGTGVLTERFARDGFRVTGIDLSGDMLAAARERFGESGLDGEFFEQPMQEMEGHSGYDVAVIAIDSLNYVTEAEEVAAVFRHAYDALNPGGRLLFDVHSPYKMTELFLEGPFTADLEDVSYIWHTYPGDEPLSVESEISFFIRRQDGLYERHEEFHLQRTFTPDTYNRLLEETGFTIRSVTADWTGDPPSENSERIFFHAVK